MVGVEVKQSVGEQAHVLEIYNEKLFLSINLLPFTPLGHQTDFAGSATSVRLYGDEMLDACARGFEDDWRKHDPEKKCLFIDQVELFSDVSDASPATVSMSNRPYRLEQRHSSPAAAIFTMVSEPFGCQQPHASSQDDRQYELVRTIKLSSQQDFVVEELSLRPSGGQKTVRQPRFSVRYTCCMDMSYEPGVYRYDGAASWFALASPHFAPFHGYGFATCAECTDPVWRLPSKTGHNAHKWFSWKTQPAQSATCLHLFEYGKPGAEPGSYDHLDHAIGHLWYEHFLARAA